MFAVISIVAMLMTTTPAVGAIVTGLNTGDTVQISLVGFTTGHNGIIESINLATGDSGYTSCIRYDKYTPVPSTITVTVEDVTTVYQLAQAYVFQSMTGVTNWVEMTRKAYALWTLQEQFLGMVPNVFNSVTEAQDAYNWASATMDFASMSGIKILRNMDSNGQDFISQIPSKCFTGNCGGSGGDPEGVPEAGTLTMLSIGMLLVYAGKYQYWGKTKKL